MALSYQSQIWDLGGGFLAKTPAILRSRATLSAILAPPALASPIKSNKLLLYTILYYQTDNNTFNGSVCVCVRERKLPEMIG